MASANTPAAGRFLFPLMAIVAVVAAFLLGMWTRPQGIEADAPRSATATEAAPQAHAPTTRADAGAPAKSVPRGSPRASMEVAAAQDDAAPAPAPRDQPRDGGALLPLLASDRAAFARDTDEWASGSYELQDALDRAASENPDADARRLAQALAQRIATLVKPGAPLRIDPPQCTPSVCLVRSAWPANLQDPDMRWEGVWTKLIRTPWYRQAFVDTRMSVGGDAASSYALTVFIRRR